MIRRLLQRFFVEPWRAVDEEYQGDTERASRDHRGPLIVAVVTCVALTLQYYYGDRVVYTDVFGKMPGDAYHSLRELAWWSAGRFLGYVALPVVALWTFGGTRVRDCFISPRGFIRHLPIYGGLYLLMVPVILVASQTDAFRTTYPFYRFANRSLLDLCMWEFLYIVQFVSLEFFFRGFMLRVLAPTMGSRAIFVMMIPYCMIHYGKPVSETLGAVGAGLILGTLAMRTRSMWGGAAIHCAVALTMDLLALGQCPDSAPCPSGH